MVIFTHGIPHTLGGNVCGKVCLDFCLNSHDFLEQKPTWRPANTGDITCLKNCFHNDQLYQSMCNHKTYLVNHVVLSTMEVPHANVFVNKTSLYEDARKLLMIFRPKWDVNQTEFQTFSGGITNALLGCFNKNNPKEIVLIRVYGDKTDLLLDRRTELKNIKRLHLAGLAPSIYGTFLNGFMYEYLPGEILTTVTCRLDNIAELVARRLADMHSAAVEDSVHVPALWTYLTKLLALAPLKFSKTDNEEKFNELFPMKLNLENEYVFLQQELSRVESPIVFCHNDLLLGNIIYNREEDTINFIDYEYAAYNYQAYDIANHFNEYAGVKNFDHSLFPDETYQKKWLKIYLEHYNSKTEDSETPEVKEEDVNLLYLIVQKYTLASHFLWAVWCLVQAEYSLIDFDYIKYAHNRFEEYFKRKKLIFSL